LEKKPFLKSEYPWPFKKTFGFVKSPQTSHRRKLKFEGPRKLRNFGGNTFQPNGKFCLVLNGVKLLSPNLKKKVQEEEVQVKTGKKFKVQ